VDLSWLVSSVIGIEDVLEGFKRFEKHLETKVVIRFKWEDDEWKVGNGGGNDVRGENHEQNGHEKGNGRHGDFARKTSWKSLEDIEAEL
jgi:hypothetical protein